jgi:hypothetical protein
MPFIFSHPLNPFPRSALNLFFSIPFRSCKDFVSSCCEAFEDLIPYTTVSLPMAINFDDLFSFFEASFFFQGVPSENLSGTLFRASGITA